jgi:hypothetical protein
MGAREAVWAVVVLAAVVVSLLILHHANII